MLRDASGARGVSLHVDTRQLPCFTIWKNTTAAADGYVTGLEPATNFPNRRSHEAGQGRVVELAAGGVARFDLDLEIHVGSAEVAAAEAAIAALQAGVEPRIFREPQPGWSDIG
jgi:hypothetical protein